MSDKELAESLLKWCEQYREEMRGDPNFPSDEFMSGEYFGLLRVEHQLKKILAGGAVGLLHVPSATPQQKQ